MAGDDNGGGAGWYFFQFDNSLAEAYAAAKLPGRHYSVLLALLRETLGRNSPTAEVSSGRLAAITGIDATNVRHALTDLRDWNLLAVESQGRGRKGLLSLQLDPSLWRIPGYGTRRSAEPERGAQRRRTPKPASDPTQVRPPKAASDLTRVPASDPAQPEPQTCVGSDALPASDLTQVPASDLTQVSAAPILKGLRVQKRDQKKREGDCSAVQSTSSGAAAQPETSPPLVAHAPAADPDPSPEPASERRPPARAATPRASASAAKRAPAPAAEIFASEYGGKFGAPRRVGPADAARLQELLEQVGSVEFAATVRLFLTSKHPLALEKAHSPWALATLFDDMHAQAQRRLAQSQREAEARAARRREQAEARSAFRAERARAVAAVEAAAAADAAAQPPAGPAPAGSLRAELAGALRGVAPAREPAPELPRGLPNLAPADLERLGPMRDALECAVALRWLPNTHAGALELASISCAARRLAKREGGDAVERFWRLLESPHSEPPVEPPDVEGGKRLIAAWAEERERYRASRAVAQRRMAQGGTA